MKKLVDERIIGLQKKYGFEALYLGSFLVLIDFMVRVVFFKKGFLESIDLYLIFILPWLYYDVRGMFGGIFVDISKQQKSINKLAGVLFSVIFLLVTLLGLTNDGMLSKFSNSDFLRGFVEGFSIVVFGALAVVMESKRRIKKREEQEKEEEQ